MFTYAQTFIDTIQNAKTNTLKSLIVDSKLRQPFQAFIEAETTFAKAVAEIADDVYDQTTDQLKKFTVK
jgi:predicted metal-dependent hydrolase